MYKRQRMLWGLVDQQVRLLTINIQVRSSTSESAVKSRSFLDRSIVLLETLPSWYHNRLKSIRVTHTKSKSNLIFSSLSAANIMFYCLVVLSSSLMSLPDAKYHLQRPQYQMPGQLHNHTTICSPSPSGST